MPPPLLTVAIKIPHKMCCIQIFIFNLGVEVFWGISFINLMEKAERIQYQAGLAITGAWQGSSRSKLYEELGWESLSERRWCRRILQIHKIVSNKTPSYLKDKLPRNRRPLYSQNNNLNTFHEIRCRSSRYE